MSTHAKDLTEYLTDGLVQYEYDQLTLHITAD